MADEDAPVLEHALAPAFDACEAYDHLGEGGEAAFTGEERGGEPLGLAMAGGDVIFPDDDPAVGSPSPKAETSSLTWAAIADHLEEIRRRFFISLIAFVPAFIAGLVFYQGLWNFLLVPLEEASPHLLRFQALGPSDGLILMMKIAFAFALMISLPVWMAQVWCFIAPGLTDRERRWLYFAFGVGGALFLAGAAVAYFLGVPFALAYLLPLNQSLAGWENSFTGSAYVDFIVTCCAGFGLAFELPLVMLVLAWFGLVTPAGIKAWWKHTVLGIFVLAAIMTPPDPFSQMMLALPMLLLFLLGYAFVVWVSRSR